MEEGQTNKSMGGVEVLVTAGAEPAQPPDQQNEGSEQNQMGAKLSFLQRAGRRLRNRYSARWAVVGGHHCLPVLAFPPLLDGGKHRKIVV